MAKIEFKSRRFSEESLRLISECDTILASYAAQGYRMTLRQLYYRLVATGVIPNEVRSYKNLGNLVSDARLAGELDWDSIEDRVRVPERPSEWEGLSSLVESALSAYRLPRWEGQENYVELWVEKDALSGVLSPLSRKHHVTLMVNRGYSSQSAMFESASRFKDAIEDGKKATLLYLGDLDPSGEDMVRDVRDRLALFGADVEVEKLALTMPQVKQYNPPPNPAKTTDSRYGRFEKKFGTESWEVDALPPNVLNGLVNKAIASLVDADLMTAVVQQEKEDKKKLREAVSRHASRFGSSR